MKKIVISIIFLSCTSLFSLEKESLLTKYLEPSSPLIQRKVNDFDKSLHFCNPQTKNGFFEKVIAPLWNSTQYTFITAWNLNLDKHTRKNILRKYGLIIRKV